MGKFILKATIFIIPLIAILVGLEYIAQTTPNAYRHKEEFITNNCDSINTLILGSSHTFYGVNPEYLENKSFNLANVSQDLKFDLYLLCRYIEKCNNIKTLVVPISYFTIYEIPLNKSEEKFRVKFYEHYMGYNDTTLYPFEKLEIYDINIFQEKISKYLNELCCKESDYGYDYNGWGTGYKESNIDEDIEKDAIKTVARHTPKGDNYIGENREYLIQIAKLCHKHNVRLFFITTPTLPAYYNKIDKSRWNYTKSIVNDICIEYNASYFNYLDDDRFDTSDFFDIDHLCHKGAEKFSKILREDIFE